MGKASCRTHRTVHTFCTISHLAVAPYRPFWPFVSHCFHCRWQPLELSMRKPLDDLITWLTHLTETYTHTHYTHTPLTHISIELLGNAPSYICRLLAACEHAAASLRLCLPTAIAKSTCTRWMVQA